MPQRQQQTNKISPMPLLLLLCLALSNQAANAEQITPSLQVERKVAIIVDDIGYSEQQGLAALALPGKITYAVIPNSPNGKALAIKAHEQNKEVILHAPMSNVHNFPLGKSGLTEHMDESNFTEALQEAIASVPHIRGVNNHMGSLLTQKRLPMEWMMEALYSEGLYFIDSRTTSHSVAWHTAQQYNVPSLKRDVFLDNERTTEAIHQQFQKFISLTKKQGYAVAIAHPYPESIAYLRQHLPRLQSEGIELISASELVDLYSPNRQHIQAQNVTTLTKIE